MTRRRPDGGGAGARACRPAALATAAAALALAALAAGCGAPPAAAPAPARRIVALAPSVSETLFALGLGDRVVGVGDYAAWPPAVATKPRLGGLLDAHLEEIVELAPDLAVLMPSEGELARHLARLGIEVLTVPFDSLADFESSAVAIARRCGVEEQGRRLVARWRTGLAPRPLARPLRVLLLVDRQPGRLGDLLAAGPGTFLGELLARLGAVDVMADLGQPYPRVSLEAVVERQPEAIVELQPGPLAPAGEATLVADWQRLAVVPAVGRGCVRVIAGDHVLIPGPRLPRLYDELAAALGACAAVAP